MTEAKLDDRGVWSKVRLIDPAPARLQVLDDILEETQDKGIIWSRFRPDLELIASHLGSKAVGYYGGIGDNQRAENYRRFKQDDTVRYLVANQASAGLGLNLSVAGVMVYYANSFSSEHRAQSEDRAEAEGKHNATLVIDLEVPRTVDSKIIRTLKNRRDLATLIMRDPKSLFMEEA